MQRVMVFIDQLNFEIALLNYYRKNGSQAPRLDYNEMPRQITAMLPGDNHLVKTFLFVPKPDEFLMQDPHWQHYSSWINGMKNQRYFTVIEGAYVARQIDESLPMDINEHRTYFKEEKGTDINIAVHVITKAFMNAYDTAVILSGDSDYVAVLDILNMLGKTTVVVGVNGQNISRLRKNSDDSYIVGDEFFQKCLRDDTHRVSNE